MRRRKLFQRQMSSHVNSTGRRAVVLTRILSQSSFNKVTTLSSMLKPV